MAEGIFKDLAKKNKLIIEVQSAGTFAFDGDNVSDNSVTAMEKMGIDISEYKSKLVHEDLIIKSDLILTMTKAHKQVLISKFPDYRNKIYLINEYAFGEYKDISDPFGGDLAEYEQARDEIYEAVKKIVEKIKDKR